MLLRRIFYTTESKFTPFDSLVAEIRQTAFSRAPAPLTQAPAPLTEWCKNGPNYMAGMGRSW
jgi:hypothetical protein